MNFDYAALERRIAALEANRGASLRFGTVTEIDEKKGTARVQLPDGENMVSWPLRVLHKRVLKDQQQCLPDIDEPVACLFAGQGMEQGVLLGACYSKKHPSPEQPPSHDYMKYEDGTEIWYDRKKHKLMLNIEGDVEIKTTKNITITAGGRIKMNASQISLQE